MLPHTQLEEVSGDDAVRCVRYRDTATGEVTKRCASEGDSFGVFVFAGYEPATELVREAAEVDEFGYIVTDRSQRTSVEGLYAAGDVCVKALRQVVTATGEAALAATEMERYVAAMQERTGLVPVRPDRATARAASLPVAANASQEGGGLFDQAARVQLDAVFGRMESSLVLRLSLGEGAASEELRAYMEELARLTDKLSVEVSEDAGEEAEAPCVRVHRADGTATGLAFHGVPGGHEFTSFVLGLYNAAGPGQPIDDESREAIAAISRPIDLKVLVSLSCTMCPDTVVAAQRIAAENPHVRAGCVRFEPLPGLEGALQRNERAVRRGERRRTRELRQEEPGDSARLGGLVGRRGDPTVICALATGSSERRSRSGRCALGSDMWERVRFWRSTWRIGQLNVRFSSRALRILVAPIACVAYSFPNML